MSIKRQFLKQAGQGMTEYIIIVALIAVAAIGVYSFFGGTIRGQTAAMAVEMGGGDGTAQKNAANAQSVKAGAQTKEKNLSSYTGSAQGK